jgi:Tol biopolymer transport system component
MPRASRRNERPAATSMFGCSMGVRANKLTTHPSFDGYPVWSPNSSQIAFTSDRSGHFSLYGQRISSVEDPKLLLEGEGPTLLPTDWSTDGRFLLFYWITSKIGSLRKSDRDVMALPLDPPGNPIPVADTPADEYLGQFSPPDGRYVAYQSNGSGTWEIYLRRFPRTR